ncbi:hypothetical protein [Neolewinella persica]|uniref:hypothetical protein n=1 Tax=Neolewinella persica TaxID=70998 RepID=UPI0003652978|nr:hypothetical protein [Neolewinella persica]
MGFLRLFKTPKNQQFSYKPRYWDPKKEEAEKLRKRVEQLQTGGVDAMKTRISGGFRKGQGGEAAGAYRSARVKRSNTTFLITLISLLVVAYIIYALYFPDLSAWITTGNTPTIE